MQILQFPDSSWGLTVLKNIFLRFIGLKGLEMVWKKSSLIWNFFPWLWLKNPCFSLISLTGKSLQNFPWIPWFPWSVGTLSTCLAPIHYLATCTTLSSVFLCFSMMFFTFHVIFFLGTWKFIRPFVATTHHITKSTLVCINLSSTQLTHR